MDTTEVNLKSYQLCMLQRRALKLNPTFSDRYFMFYSQSPAKGHIRPKQNVFLRQVKFLFTYYLKTHSTIEDLKENEVD